MNEFIVSSSVEYALFFVRKRNYDPCNTYDAGLNCTKIDVSGSASVLFEKENAEKMKLTGKMRETICYLCNSKVTIEGRFYCPQSYASSENQCSLPN